MQDLSELKQQAEEIIFHSETEKARELIKELEFRLKKLSESSGGSKEETEECSKILTRLKMLRLALLTDEEVNRLIREYAIEMLCDPDLDLIDRAEARQLIFPRLMRHEMVNEPIMEALHQNQETIGDEKIFIPSKPEAMEPTVENWLLDYDQTYGTEPQKDLVWLEYVNTGKNAAHLEPKDKDTLRKLLKFYEFLKPEYVGE